MSAPLYFSKITHIIQDLEQKSMPDIQKAAGLMADSIAAGRAVYYFGSGHSVIPALDVFPRYGSFVGLQPIHDTRLMWSNVIGPGGTPELLWLEKQEGYVQNVFDSYVMTPQDSLIVISHGGLNAAGIEAAMYAREHGVKVIAITSMNNYHNNAPRHSSGKKLADLADVVIDNGAPPEDSIIKIEGWDEPVAASSTVTVLVISMALIAETTSLLAKRGIHIPTFVSPNVMPDADHNKKVYSLYKEFRRKVY
ncbi:MAG: SIS domain-containing protein [Anaerolineales bacterium]|nr:SIS domain-containing protein [Anaerolineales bacterium]